MKRLTVETLLVVLVLVLAMALHASRQSNDAALAQLRAKGQTNDSLKNVNAQLWAEKTRPRIDTVRIRGAAYKGARDTIRLTDTVQVLSVLAKADSLFAECTSLATACSEYRDQTEKLLESLTTEREGWRRLYENAAHPKCGRKCGILIGIAASVGAAFVVDRLNSAVP